MSIRFYRVSEEYGCLSNFSPHPINVDGKVWPTTEHYFQAQKFTTIEPSYAEEIRQANKPGRAAVLGRDRKHKLRKDWEAIKDDVMRKAVAHKFWQYKDIQEVLLSTDTQKLVEATTDDHYWGCGSNGNGKNMLGIILVEVRGVIRQELNLENEIKNASSHMEEDVLANLPSPLQSYLSNLRV